MAEKSFPFFGLVAAGTGGAAGAGAMGAMGEGAATGGGIRFAMALKSFPFGLPAGDGAFVGVAPGEGD